MSLQNVAELAVIAIFVVWFALSLISLFPGARNILRHYDRLTLIPEWKFFAPNPGQWDYHLVYRDHLLDGNLTDWTEVTVAEQRHWWNAVWNPGKRGSKALTDCVVILARHVVAQDPGIEASIPYLNLLNHISSFPRLGEIQHTQFALVQTHARGVAAEPDVMFLSHLHDC